MKPYSSQDKLVVYTAIFGDYDELLEPKIAPNNVEFVCFSDRPLTSRHWKIYTIPMEHIPVSSDDSVRASRWFKLLPHRFFEGTTIWVDANVLIKGNPTFALNLETSSMATFRHSVPGGIYEEASRASKRRGGADLRLCSEQAKAFRYLGMPTEQDLLAGTVLVRKNTEQQRRFNEAWWKLYLAGSSRDQLPLNFLVWLLDYPVRRLEGTLHVSEWHRWLGVHKDHPHAERVYRKA